MRKTLLISGITVNLLSLIFAFATNFSTVIIFIYCCSLLMIVYGIFLNNKRMLKILTLMLGIVIVIFIGFTVFIYQYGQNDNVTYDEDAIIVLGAKVNGETPSLLLTKRLNAAWQYYSQNPDVIVIVSGGQGTGEDVSEAVAMERYLIDKGVPAGRIIREEHSTTTYENILFSKQILDDHFDGVYRTVIVTNDFHIFRSVLIAEGMGMESSHVHAEIPRHSMPANYLRETIAIAFQVLFPR